MDLVHDWRKAGCWLERQLASILVPISLHRKVISLMMQVALQHVSPALQSLALTQNVFYHSLLETTGLYYNFANMTIPATMVPAVCDTKVNAMQHAYPGANDVHAMAASIVQLLQLHKALHLFPAPAADNRRGKQSGH